MVLIRQELRLRPLTVGIHLFGLILRPTSAISDKLALLFPIFLGDLLLYVKVRERVLILLINTVS